MTFCVRRIDSRRLWDAPLPDEGWLGDRELQADALRDLTTEENKLSIWEVDDESGASLSRILAAIAAGRQHLAKLDFVLFKFTVVGELDISFERAEGDTFDADVNARHLHLMQLTAGSLAEFGARIRSDGQIKRCPDKKVAQLIRESISQRFIDPTRLNLSLARRVIT